MGDWGKRIRLVFADDGGGADLYSVVSEELITKFRLREDTYGTFIYPTSVTVGDAPNVLYLNFADFNQVQVPCTLQYLGGASLRGQDLTVDAFDLLTNMSWWNLNRQGDCEYLELTSVTVTGEVALGFDGKAYHDEYLEILSVTISGTNALVTFKEARSNHEYLEITSVTVAGTYADADGIPI